MLGFVGIGVGVAAGAGAIAAAVSGAHLRSNVANDIDIHKANYGEGCARGDYRLCAYDTELINHDADRANGLRNASIGLAVGALVAGGGGLALVLLNPAPKSAAPKSDDAKPTAPEAASAPRLACGFAGAGALCGGSF